MVGDPSGRSEERNLLDQNELSSNVAAVARQLKSVLRFDGDADLKKDGRRALLVDNRDWTAKVHVLDFLRDVGKHVTVGTMLSKESVKTRLASEQGLSFTEISYMLLQANDFYELYENYGWIICNEVGAQPEITQQMGTISPSMQETIDSIGTCPTTGIWDIEDTPVIGFMLIGLSPLISILAVIVMRASMKQYANEEIPDSKNSLTSRSLYIGLMPRRRTQGSSGCRDPTRPT